MKKSRKEQISRQSVNAVPYAILTETTSQRDTDNSLRHLHTVFTSSCCSLSKTLLPYSQGDTDTSIAFINCIHKEILLII